MARILSLILFVCLLSCNTSEKQLNPFRSTHVLTGTCWSSNVGYYHNDYYFLTDSTARWEQNFLSAQASREHIQHLPPDDADTVSGTALLFNYRAHDSVLYIISSQNGAPDTALYIRKNFKDSAYYLSERSSAFGRQKIYLQSCKKE